MDHQAFSKQMHAMMREAVGERSAVSLELQIDITGCSSCVSENSGF